MPSPARRTAPPKRGPRAAAARAEGLIVPVTGIAAEIVDFASRLKVGEGSLVGQPLHLMPWELMFLARVFGARRMRRALLSIARRNGKTGLVAIIVLAALFGPLAVPNSLIVSASRSREQAGIVYNYAKKMLIVSGLDHLVRFRDSAKQILCPRFGTEYRAVSADATTSLGYGVRLAIHDELGQVRGPRDPLYEAMSTGMGTYADSLELIISTQAPSDGDLFNLLMDDALAANDDEVYGQLHAAPAGSNLLDEAAWLLANPSLPYGVRDRGDLMRMAKEALRLPARENAFRNFMLNQRVSAKAPFLSPAVWDACAGPIDEGLFLRAGVHLGLDLSARQDLTAGIFSAEDDSRRVHLKPLIWTPEATLIDRAARDRAPYDLWRKQGFLEPMPGMAIDLELIAKRLAELCSTMRVERIMFDRWRMAELRRWLEKEGAWHVIDALKEHGQGFRDMTTAVDLFEQLALEGRLVHGGHPVLRWAVSNVEIQRDPAGNRKPDKSEAFGRIDPAVAAMMSVRSIAGDVEKATIGGDQIRFV